MNRLDQTTNIFNYTMEAWENAFAQLNQSEVGTKEYNQAVKIMMAIDSELTAKLIENDLDNEETAATTEQTNTITAYHGTHNTNVSFTNDRTITNYNHIGTWFTSTLDHAKTLYGDYVYECSLTINNPFYATTEGFDNVFYIPSLASQYNVTVDNLWNNGAYIQAVKDYYTSQGYDSIIFENSRIDLSPEDKEHTVYIALDVNMIN